MNKWTFKVRRHEFELLLVRTEHYKRFFFQKDVFLNLSINLLNSYSRLLNYM